MYSSATASGLKWLLPRFSTTSLSWNPVAAFQSSFSSSFSSSLILCAPGFLPTLYSFLLSLLVQFIPFLQSLNVQILKTQRLGLAFLLHALFHRHHYPQPWLQGPSMNKYIPSFLKSPLSFYFQLHIYHFLFDFPVNYTTIHPISPFRSLEVSFSNALISSVTKSNQYWPWNISLNSSFPSIYTVAISF